MADRLVSIVLPVHNQADHIRAVVEEYREALRRVPDRYEILLVPNGCRDDSAAVCGALAAEAPDRIDLEFSVICRRESYPMLEVPIFSHRRHGGRSTTSLRSAVRLYWGAYTMWREAR